jgi:hypothetical protein
MIISSRFFVKNDALAPMEAAAPRIGNLFFTAGTERPTEAPGPPVKKGYQWRAIADSRK